MSIEIYVIAQSITVLIFLFFFSLDFLLPMDFGNHRIPDEQIVIKSQSSYILVNIRPFLPYHMLVVPIRKVNRLRDLMMDEYIDLMSLLKQGIDALDSLGTAWTVVVQDGEDAGQTVKHVHIHLIPRKEGDIARNNDIYDKINIDIQKPNRSLKEMEEEANFLRTYFE